MPVFTAYIGFSSVSYLIYKSSSEYFFGTYPYVYSPDVFGNYVSEGNYYKDLFTGLCKDHNIKFSDCDVVIGTFLTFPQLDFTVKKKFLLNEILNGISSDTFPVLLNSYSIITPDKYLCYLSVGQNECDEHPEKHDPEEIAFYYNSAIYQNVIPFEMNVLVDQDRNIVSKLCKNELKFSNDKTVTFMGSRFCYPYGKFNQEIDYILMLNLIREPGIYTLELDRDRYKILKYMLKAFVVNADLQASGKIEKVGTLINTYGDVECMITSEVGTSQLMDIDKDRVFIVPLNYNEKAHIIVKNSVIGTLERDVTGGRLGIIFDTRMEKFDITANLRVFNESVKVINQAFNKI